ncbi:hypothetical protein [Halomarina litorea]|uniref:hypothetical protein n=1 Tax=Halomarina litorea TaxID=2961595 RepID=UPI0020C586B5|nr:hypothetical protein [Halomarina sp. BCD28]
MSDDESLLPYAGVGGVALCCLGLELLGGAALLSGVVAAVGVSAEVGYLVVVGIGGLVAVLLVAGYQRIGANATY